MASFKAVPAILEELKNFLQARAKAELADYIHNPDILILGTKELDAEPTGNHLGIYLHRISVDPFGRNRYLNSTDIGKPMQPELPINLHFLLVAWTDTGENESALISWGLQHIGASLELNISHIGGADKFWRDHESVQIIPEEMSTEDLLRIWDGLPRSYKLSVPFLVKTVRLLPVPERVNGPLVKTVVTPMSEIKPMAKET